MEAGLQSIRRRLRLHSGGSSGAGRGAASGGRRLQPFSCSLRRLPTGAAGSGATVSGADGGAGRSAGADAASGGGGSSPSPAALDSCPLGLLLLAVVLLSAVQVAVLVAVLASVQVAMLAAVQVPVLPVAGGGSALLLQPRMAVHWGCCC
ncbi:hypothetical protein NDU88_003028 [Pleurodeles waltl]|uniref:Uncharacterized protein n=1 Tax=Pleurodeles waltl TaxID=8319 RepID=A0AAV7PDH3_PLEWA|nr:hypothetical protein NDU88_003028 [Pleurodeles waltl]